jgi:predicted NAD/FAD-binding protein
MTGRRIAVVGDAVSGITVGYVLSRTDLRTGGFSRYFTAHFALPLVAAAWSCPTGTALRYPARYLFAFLANHGMLPVRAAAAASLGGAW